MVIPFVVPEILGGSGTTPPDAIKLSEKADAINRYATRTFRFPVWLSTFLFSIFINASTLDVYYNKMARLSLQLSKQKSIRREDERFSSSRFGDLIIVFVDNLSL